LPSPASEREGGGGKERERKREGEEEGGREGGREEGRYTSTVNFSAIIFLFSSTFETEVRFLQVG
jgi:hypothetical protein